MSLRKIRSVLLEAHTKNELIRAINAHKELIRQKINTSPGWESTTSKSPSFKHRRAINTATAMLKRGDYEKRAPISVNKLGQKELHHDRGARYHDSEMEKAFVRGDKNAYSSHEQAADTHYDQGAKAHVAKGSLVRKVRRVINNQNLRVALGHAKTVLKGMPAPKMKRKLRRNLQNITSLMAKETARRKEQRIEGDRRKEVQRKKDATPHEVWKYNPPAGRAV